MSPALECGVHCKSAANRLPQHHTRPTEQKEVMKTDTELKTDVLRELAWDIHIDEAAIGVTAHHGVVTLNGVVECWAEKHVAEEAAHRVAGVLDVANEIEIKPSWSATRSDADIAEAVRGALTWSRFVPGQEIRSTVADHGTGTLTGEVRTLAQRDEAERLVHDLAGVQCVSNQITVDGPAIAEAALHETIKQALERHVAREVDGITVDVQGDTVVLSGGVASWRERRAVLGAAKGTPGVRRIDDRLRIQS
jgi:osmotically-inducible protein OsmY